LEPFSASASSEAPGTNVNAVVMTLPGQETLLACWSALAQLSPGARLVVSPLAVAAVFPSWEPLNNAILHRAGNDSDAAAAAAASELRAVYNSADVDGWALWIPRHGVDLDAPDDLPAVDGLERDATTLVMKARLSAALRRHDRVVRASIAAVGRIGVDPVNAGDLGMPEEVARLAGWAMVQDGMAVCGAWTYLHDDDCGIFAVETVPAWRRRGLARALVEHALSDAWHRGARTATLQSTRMAQRLYESLGFEAAGRYEEWTSVQSERL
jgi:ribosomal protein S18 acetylase RimI-like enzyme